ncbi:TetR/AcrR family transcriptional regulator [Bordetella sp. BOR01]|uniref:TetR/AcrR family transcriptional regulator n=1 Tax=Bordetella sp. BOR01 TaxID=2854779 RepID=UPI001C46C62C|nr:TetR/AcrR family transcriptional regulator [Bordetella sp. BOR01]MBV7484866.1 TetR/AcrR family transcriptional regulator [Bordetella sp. BOR01]
MDLPTNPQGTVKSKVDAPELVAKRRSQFINAAIDLFGQHGYHVTTIREIAQAAKVSIGLIYQYVEDKEDILFLALLTVLDTYAQEIPKALEGLEDPLERFRAAVHAYCHVNDSNANATVLAYRETKSLRKERRVAIQQKELDSNALIAACIQDCIDAGIFEKTIDIELMTYQLVMFSHAWALKSWRFRGMMSVDTYVDRGLDLMLGPVLTVRGRRVYQRQRPAL